MKKKVRVEIEYLLEYEDKRHLPEMLKELKDVPSIDSIGCGFIEEEGPFSYSYKRTKKKAKVIT